MDLPSIKSPIEDSDLDRAFYMYGRAKSRIFEQYAQNL